MKVAILDDYQNLAMTLADWGPVKAKCEVTVFDRHLGTPEQAAEALQPFDAICMLRERTALPRQLLEKLPNLKLIAVTGAKHRTLDMDAANELGILVSNTEKRGEGAYSTPELAWGLILAVSRHIPSEAARMREGGWQTTLGTTLDGKTLGVLGLGRLGPRMVPIAKAFGMEVIAWSQNMTDEQAKAAGTVRVEKDELFRRADFVSLHVVLSDRTRGIVGKREFELMKPTAYLINTARGPLVDEQALFEALQTGKIAGAGIDVYHREPLPDDDPIRKMPNVVLTPHLGYTVEELLRVFYKETVENVAAFANGKPIRMMNPQVLEKQG